MAVTFGVLGGLGLFLAWAVLPLLPSLLEIVRKSDVKPLRVVRGADVDIRHFATAFRNWALGHLGEAAAVCRLGGGPVHGQFEDGTAYVVLNDDDAPIMTLPPTGPPACPMVTVGSGHLRLPARSLFPLEVYAAGNLDIGQESVCRAALAGGELRLGHGCWSLRWLHAGASLTAAGSCALHGRASADVAMQLGDGCRFERLHAPRIAFGTTSTRAAAPAVLEPLAAADVPGLVEDRAGRWLVRRALEIPANRLVTADLVVAGEVRVGSGTRIVGSVKSHGDLRLAAGVEVDGSLVSWRDVIVGTGCRIRGPVIAERDARIATATVLGAPGRPSTLSVRCLEIESGCVVHGTVWAHGGAVVLARGSEAAASTPPIRTARES